MAKINITRLPNATSDVLKVQANAANQVHIIASFMQITKGEL